jgi:N-acetyl sugar amidotransferase
MKICKKCLFPDSKPQLEFDENDVCDACRYAEEKEIIDWNERKNDLKKILEKYKKNDQNNYDCLIPISGGKDSTYQTYMIKEFGLNPLVVNFRPRDYTDIGIKNMENLKNLGVDCIEFSANPHVYKKLAMFGLTELGDPMWPEHIGLFQIPIKMAVNFKIPLIVWGENPMLEYGGPVNASSPYLDKSWLENHGGYFLDKIKPEDMTRYGIRKNELIPFIYPSDEDIKKIGVTGIFLGYYLNWDARKQLEIVKKLGFSVLEGLSEGTFTNFENLDSKIVPLHDYFKYLKYGYGRTTDQASIDIRNKRMTRDEGIKLVKEFEEKIPEKCLTWFLDEYNLNRDEFIKICDKFTNKEIFETDEFGKIKHDENGNVKKLSF